MHPKRSTSAESLPWKSGKCLENWNLFLQQQMNLYFPQDCDTATIFGFLDQGDGIETLVIWWGTFFARVI